MVKQKTNQTNNEDVSSSNEASSAKYPPHLTLGKLILKSSLLAILIFLGMMLITLAGVVFFAYYRVNNFLQKTSLDWNQVVELAKHSQNGTVPNQDGYTNFLILGTDTVPNKPNAPILTDTIILASLNHQTGNVNLVSLPRDLWDGEYQTRINALYYYGQERYPDNPALFPTEVISTTLNVPINYTIVISLDTLSQLVDAVGGIEVEVTEGFVDEQYPRSDVDVAVESDPEKLYKTISFSAGVEVMSGERVMEYVRSRYSDGDEGTDLSRARRQQAVFSALIEKMKTPQVLLNPHTAARIFQIYEKQLAPQLPLPDLVVFAKTLFPVRDQIQLLSHQLEIYPDSELGAIEHPPVTQTQGQWVYIVRDINLLQTEIYDKLSDTE